MQPIRLLSSELQKKAIEEINEDPNQIGEDLKHIKDWLKKQPHLNPRNDDQFLANFARGCKWRMRQVKEKLDCYYSMRTLVPEFFSNRDPLEFKVQKVLQAGILYPLPNACGPSGPRIVFYNFENLSVEHTPFDVLVKIFFMSLDVLMLEDDRSVVSGLFIIGNYNNVPLRYITQLTPSLLSKYMKGFENAYPFRLNRFLGFSVPQPMVTFYNTIWKSFTKPKLFNRMVLLNEKNFCDHIDVRLLPEEFGGKNGSLPELAAQWKQKLESYREWFINDAKYKSNENLRLGESNSNFQEFGADGSFKKLNVD